MTNQAPPASKQAEAILLGQAMSDAEYVVPQLRSSLKIKDFYWRSHQLVYKAILEAHHKHQTAEVPLVAEELGDKVTTIGGRSYLFELINKVTTTTSAEHYAEIVKEKAARRKIIEQSRRRMEAAEEDVELESIIADMDQDLKSVVGMGKSRSVGGAELFEAFEASKEASGAGGWEGVPWKIDAFDDALGGLQSGTLSFLIGPTRVGKTLSTINTAIAQARTGISVGYISIEMNERQLSQRVMQCITKQTKEHLYTKASDKYLKSFKRVMETAPWEFLFQVADIDKIILQILEWDINKVVDIVYIDYLQRIEDTGTFRTLREKYSNIVRRLANITNKVESPIICLSQVNRASEINENITIHSIKYCGDAENEADKVFMLIPNWEQLKEEYSVMEIELVKGKDRDGPTGHVPLKFDYPKQQIETI